MKKNKNEEMENSVPTVGTQSPSSFSGKNELLCQHRRLCIDQIKTHANVSIEYAIQVIEEMKKETELGLPFKDQERILRYFGNRIDELKALLK